MWQNFILNRLFKRNHLRFAYIVLCCAMKLSLGEKTKKRKASAEEHCSSKLLLILSVLSNIKTRVYWRHCHAHRLPSLVWLFNGILRPFANVWMRLGHSLSCAVVMSSNKILIFFFARCVVVNLSGVEFEWPFFVCVYYIICTGRCKHQRGNQY